jgi:hypothetical protein
MKITIEPTSTIVEIGGVPSRLWAGQTDDGTPCRVFVTLVAVANDRDQTWFNGRMREIVGPDNPEILMAEIDRRLATKS